MTFYVACILDAWSRRCLGGHLARSLDTALALAALAQARSARQPAPGLLHHSDRGVLYASTAYVTSLTAAGTRIGMSAKGSPYDNAKAESFFKTLKTEEVYLDDHQTFADAEAHLDRFIADVYNATREHSSLGYDAPNEFEARYHATPTPSH